MSLPDLAPPRTEAPRFSMEAWGDDDGVRGGCGRRPDQVAFSATVAGLAFLGLAFIAIACASGLLDSHAAKRSGVQDRTLPISTPGVAR